MTSHCNEVREREYCASGTETELSYIGHLSLL